MNAKLILVFLTVIILAACGTEQEFELPDSEAGQAPDDAECEVRGDNVADGRGPTNDSEWNWSEGDLDIPCDYRIYTITGSVSDEARSVSRQGPPNLGSVGGFTIQQRPESSGNYSGDFYLGRGFIRLRVESSDSELAPEGSTVILKTTDAKASMLLPNDRVTFKCRAEYEAVGALLNSEEFDETTLDLAETWELDYCRLVTPIVINP